MPVDALLSNVPMARLDAEQTRRIGHGQAIPWDGVIGSRLRLISDTGVFLGVGNVSMEHMIHPERLIANG
jgi:hypothetical protein